MTAEIVSLRRVRKARVRAEAETTAAANRAKFGRTKAQRLADAGAAAYRDRALDGARLDTSPLS